MKRTVKKIIMGNTQYDGAGVRLVRVISRPDVEDFDPFLMLDAFDSHDPEDYIKGFPWHPHRGIETITYLIHGDIEHGDSIGNKGSILDGCCQWMTAGSGIMHQEMPKKSQRMLGVQLWLNLPKKDKMTAPQYRDIKANMIPEVKEEKCTIHVISGNYKNTKAPVQGDYVKALFLDVQMEPGAEWKLETEAEDTLFVYIVEGEGYFGDSYRPSGIEPGAEYDGESGEDPDEKSGADPLKELHHKSDLQLAKRAILFNKGDEFRAAAGRQGIRFLLISGHPLKEPVAWGGPIVMNTKEELDLAFREIEAGRFIKTK